MLIVRMTLYALGELWGKRMCLETQQGIKVIRNVNNVEKKRGYLYRRPVRMYIPNIDRLLG